MKTRTRELLGFDGTAISGSDISEVEFIAWFDAKIVPVGVEDRVIADIERRGFEAVLELVMVYRLDSLGG